MPTGNHTETVKWMKCICKTIFPYVFLVCCKIFPITIDIWKSIHIIMLKKIIHFFKVRPSFVMEKSIAQRRTDNHTVITHNAFKPKYLCTQSLHHHNRIGTHSITIMELLWHTKYKNIIFLFRPMHICSFISNFPA